VYTDANIVMGAESADLAWNSSGSELGSANAVRAIRLHNRRRVSPSAEAPTSEEDPYSMERDGEQQSM
jgi:hypothetical protein